VNTLYHSLQLYVLFCIALRLNHKCRLRRIWIKSMGIVHVLRHSSACAVTHALAQVAYCMYVCRLLHIGRIRMDIDNSRVTWELDKTCKASNVSML
jgi:hypothetical protein